ncbi:SDR family oxidoreductase [Caballeronia sp. dw_19]|uniref:SDR family NAD(P)-dependent oxidoreductase n=1 Tax=Caballeronia sp. dw_19 TaxID=2719791 RepID=UPI001BCED830|nr:SDR family oxidoreductase [Caballeronia sp. dw_19]
MQQFRLDGKVALVTGAGEGIGAAIAVAFAGAGADVILVARTRSKLEYVAEQARKAGSGRMVVAPCDVTSSQAMRALIGGLPALDIAVNNAGTNFPGPFVDVSADNLETMLTLNVRSYFVVAQAAVRKMLESDSTRSAGRSVINISSQMGHVGAPERSAYCMTKHAVEGLTKAMAVELAHCNIRVNSIAPTFIDTPLIRRIVDTREKHAALVSRIPLGRLGCVEDVASAAIYLASPAAAMITGTCLLTDGGWTAQ